MDMFNFSSQAVGDGHRLNSILSSLPRTAFVDLRFNRITVAGLQQVVTWLKSRPAVSVCVTGNLFAFDAFYSTLKDMDAIDFVVQRRLNMSYTDQEWRIEQLALERKQNDRILQIEDTLASASRIIVESAKASAKATTEADERHRKVLEAAKEAAKEADERRRKAIAEADERRRKAMAEAEERDREFHKRLDKQNKTVSDMVGWQRNQNDAFEDIVSGALEKFLVKHGFQILQNVPRVHRMVPSMRPIYEVGVEWDGIVHCRKGTDRYVYLVEAKSHVKEDHISGMVPRIQRTKEFIALCANGTLPDKNKYTSMCYSWALLQGAAVRGVVGASVFPGDVRAMAADLGFVTVSADLESYTVLDPVDGASDTFAAPLSESDSESEESLNPK